jgi:hypothetical protein
MTLRAALAAAAVALPLAAGALPGRVAVLAGANVGAPGRAKLWFAERDAQRLERTLRELGEFGADQIELLRGPTAEGFREALRRAEAKVEASRAAGAKTLLLVYYSGHAGAGGLEFGAERVSYDELKDFAARSGAEAKVIVVDACEAGTMTQVKGARPEARVDFLLPAEEVKGTAFIASTAVGEAAQESAAIGGSVFTHHLDVALRGAGDADGDGLVTLSEAFRYTAAATVAATTATQTGPQHPTYDFRMSGRGDVVLADLRRAEAKLLVPVDPGALYVVRGPKGAVVAEVPASTSELALALPAGTYGVERRAREGRATGEVALARGETRTLPRLTPTRYELARAKGGPMPTELWIGAGATLPALQGVSVAPGLRAGIRRELGPVGLVVHADFSATSGSSSTAGSFSLTRFGGGLTALYPVAGSRVLLEGGLDLGAGWNQQAMGDGRHFETGDATAGAALRLSFPLGGWRAALDGTGGLQTLKVNGSRAVRPAATLTVVVLYGM